MLRRRYVLGAIVLGVLIVSTLSEPLNRNQMGVFATSEVLVDCAGSRVDSPECRALNGEPKNAEISNKNETEDDTWGLTLPLADDSVDEARGKKKKKGLGRVLFIVGAAMKATMMYVMIHAVALLAGKALVVAKIALALAASVALKKALEHNDKTSYEIVKHPQHSISQTHSSSVDYDHHGFEGHRRKKRFTR